MSDLSSFLKEELSNTLEQLLTKNTIVDSISLLDVDTVDDVQCIEVSVKFEFSTISSIWNFFIPVHTATKFEYFMLGGMGDLKEHIDDEIADAVNEIISNICGSFCTSVNAQGYQDVNSIKSEVLHAQIKSCNSIEDKNVYVFDLALDGEKLSIYIQFDDIIKPYLSSITGYERNNSDLENNDIVVPTIDTNTNSNIESNNNIGPNVNALSALLSEESAENLQLLFNIKLKLSVRLGTKNFLLKDILRWDIGEIIELDQMVNEPLDILVNGVKVGEGEAVIVEGKFGLKIKNIGDSSAKLNQIGI